MSNVQEVHFDPIFKLLICKVHGSGVHPTTQAITRHLRGEGHRCGGQILKQTISILTSLPLYSLEEIQNVQPAVEDQPLSPPIRHLKVLPGWSCTPCAGHFLTTSREIVQRHTASQHGRRRGQQPLWETCELQTFFTETKDRRYFRVARSPDGGNHQYHANHAMGEELDGILRCTNYFSPAQSPPVAMGMSIVPWHPFMHIAQRYVRLSETRLDSLLKSDAFRSAAHPIFDSSHVDAALSMRAVFPQSEDEPVFVNALLYSTVHLINRGLLTTESLSLKAKTLKLLSEKLATPPYKLPPTALGAVMILKATAYKVADVDCHAAHTKGLTKALEGDTNLDLTPAARQAIFWLDVMCSSAHRQQTPDLSFGPFSKDRLAA